MTDLSITSENKDFILNKKSMQANVLTSAQYDYSEKQLDLMFSILAQLVPDETKYIINLKDLEELTGTDWHPTYTKQLTENMLTRVFKIYEEDVDTYTQFVIFQYFKYRGNGDLEIKIAEHSLHYFQQLKNNFTQYQLKSLLACTSKHAKRLYMLACQWRNLQRIEAIDIDDFKSTLNLIELTGKNKGAFKYKEINAFREKVLDVAIEQINSLTDIELSYELIKRGRSFKFIQFKINKIKQLNMAISTEKPIHIQKYERDLQSEAYGLTPYQAEQVAKKIKRSDFEEFMSKNQVKILKAENKTALLVHLLNTELGVKFRKE